MLELPLDTNRSYLHSKAPWSTPVMWWVPFGWSSNRARSNKYVLDPKLKMLFRIESKPWPSVPMPSFQSKTLLRYKQLTSQLKAWIYFLTKRGSWKLWNDKDLYPRMLAAMNGNKTNVTWSWVIMYKAHPAMRSCKLYVGYEWSLLIF